MQVGIEAINLYGGKTLFDVNSLFKLRGLDSGRIDNLMMKKKSVALPCEDSVTNGVNASKAIIDSLSESEKNKIEMVITASESGIDFGKSISTYIHAYLNLNKNCKLFEIKQACYGGSAGLHIAVNYIASNISPGSKVLVVATDISRMAAKNTYAEPSQGTGAIAMLISDKPEILSIDMGANGFYSYEVMDTCRPLPDVETGDPDLSLLSYLECLEKSYTHYCEKVENVDISKTFDYMIFHTPFPGMVKGAHKKMIRTFNKTPKIDIVSDFEKRVAPSLDYCSRVGNVYSATVFFALCSLIDKAEYMGNKRIGLFAYGSGCSSEFYSGVISDNSKSKLGKMKIKDKLDDRYELNAEEYEKIVDLNMSWIFGIKERTVDFSTFGNIYDKCFKDKELLILNKIENFHREYNWS